MTERATLYKNIVFAIVVTLAGLTIDLATHMLTNITVHFPYVSIKFLVVAVTIFFFSQWAGINWKHGLAATFAASLMFYFYYRFTEPTLDRTVFTLDEQLGWAAFHFAAMYLPYFLTAKFLLTKNESR